MMADPFTYTARRLDCAGIGKILALIVLTCLCYWPSLGGGFLWDDAVLITHDPLVQSFGGLRRIWFSTEPYDYFPLTYTSFWLEWPLWGGDPLGYRVVNLGLHLLGTFLLWRVLWRLRVPGAWLGALLFAVHPVNVASVAWIAERKNTLSMVFCLASVLCWIESDDLVSSDGKRARWYVAAVGLFVLAALSKSSVVMLPCVLLLLVWWRRGNVRQADLSRTAPFFAVSLAAGLLTIWFQLHRSLAAANWHRADEPVLLRVLIAGRAMLFYLGKTVAPVRLGMVYPRWEMSPTSVTAWLPLSAVAGMLFAAWHGRGRWGRGPLTVLGCFMLMALPVSGLVTMTFAVYSFVSDHLVYLPMIGLLAGMAALVATWSERGGKTTRWTAWVVGTLLVGWFSAAGHWRAEEFGSSRRLWQATLTFNPRCAIAHNNLGLALQDGGQLPDAEAHFRTALALEPDLAAAASNLGVILQREGRWRESAAVYAVALQQVPDAQDLNNDGVALLQLGETGAAQRQFQAAARLEPAMLSPRFNLYKIALAHGDNATAADELRACLHIDPDDVPSLLALAALGLKADTSSGVETVRLATRACQLTREADEVALATLSRAYLAAGRRGDATSTAEKALNVCRVRGQKEAVVEIARYLTTIRDGS